MISLSYSMDLNSTTDAYYSFDNDNLSGINPLDLTPNGYDGVNTNANTNLTGIVAESFYYNGVDSVINVNNLLDTYSSEVSFSFWFKFNTTFSSSSSSSYAMLSKSNIDGDDRFIISSNSADGKIFFFYEANAGGNQIISTTTDSWTGDTWYYMTITWDSSGDIKLYVDGSLETTSTGHNTMIQTGSHEDFKIGTRYGNVNFMEGLIDEVAIFNTSLNTTEIDFLYGGGSPTSDQQYPYVSISPTPSLEYLSIKVNNVTMGDDVFFNVSLLDWETILNSTNTNNNTDQSYLLSKLFVAPLQLTTDNSSYPVNINSLNQYCSQFGFSNGLSLTNTSGTTAFWTGSMWSPLTSSVGTSLLKCSNNTNVQYATNNLTGEFSLSLTDGLYNIILNASNNETNTSDSFNFTVDTNAPNLVTTFPSTFPTYINFNISSFISINDVTSNVTSCIVEVVGQSNTTCSDTSYTFLVNGNATINVLASDEAGNQVTSLNNIILVNPSQCHNFFRANDSTAITNYTFGGSVFSSNPACFDTYSDGLVIGNNSIVFEKLGFASTNVLFEINLTSEINVSVNITESQIQVTIFDRATGSILTGLTNIILVATQGFTGNTTTGFINISNINFLSETYQLVAEHADYATEQVFFTYSNQEILPLNVFMLALNDSNFGILTVKTVTSNSVLIPNAQCDLQEWDPSLSSFISVAQGLTDTQGEFTFNIELDVKVYKILCSKGGVTSSSLPTEGGIISVSGNVFPVIMDDPTTFIESRLKNFVYSFSNSTETNTTQRLTFTFDDSDGLVTEACINIYHGQGLGRFLNSSTCASGASGEIQIIININNSFDITAQATVETADGVIENLQEIIFKGTGALQSLLQRYNLDMLLPLFFVLGFIALGLNMDPQNVYISVLGAMLGTWFSFAIVPSVISLSIAVTVQIIGTLMLLWGATR
jgi:hypothetical protein